MRYSLKRGLNASTLFNLISFQRKFYKEIVLFKQKTFKDLRKIPYNSFRARYNLFSFSSKKNRNKNTKLTIS